MAPIFGKVDVAVEDVALMNAYDGVLEPVRINWWSVPEEIIARVFQAVPFVAPNVCDASLSPLRDVMPLPLGEEVADHIGRPLELISTCPGEPMPSFERELRAEA